MKIKYSPYDWIADAVCLTLLAGVTVYVALMWEHLPDLVPGHYNAAGVADRMGNKAELWFLPGTAWFLYLGISIISRFPQIWNTGVKVTGENAERVYRVLKNLLNTMKMLMACVFTGLTLFTASALALPAWFLPAFLLFMFGTIGYFTWRLVRVR